MLCNADEATKFVMLAAVLTPFAFGGIGWCIAAVVAWRNERKALRELELEVE